MPSHACRTFRVRSEIALAATVLAGMAAGAAAGHAQTVDPLDRVQLHRHGSRGVPFLPLAQAGAAAGGTSLTMRAALTVELDGDPLLNTYSGLAPADGSFEFVQYNGFNFVQVWDAAGRKLWRVENPDGRTHDMSAGTARDTVAVLDLDGDGKDELVTWGQSLIVVGKVR